MKINNLQNYQTAAEHARILEAKLNALENAWDARSEAGLSDPPASRPVVPVMVQNRMIGLPDSLPSHLAMINDCERELATIKTAVDNWLPDLPHQ